MRAFSALVIGIVIGISVHDGIDNSSACGSARSGARGVFDPAPSAGGQGNYSHTRPLRSGHT